MKRPLLFVSLIILVFAHYYGQVHRMNLFERTKQHIPTHQVLEPNLHQFEGHIVEYQKDRNVLILQTFHPTTGKEILIRLRTFNSPDLMDKIDKNEYLISARVDLNRNNYRSFKNKTGFDYDTYLYGLNIWGQYDLLDYDLRKCSQACIKCRRLVMRKTLKTSIDNRFDDPEAGFLKAMLLADRSEYDLYELFQNHGLAHLFAISGLHFGFIYQLFKRIFLFPSRILKSFILIFSMALLLFWVGQSYSAQRAFYIILYCEIASLMHRQKDPLNAIAFSALLIIIRHPYAVSSLSFQLSFIAYFCVAVLLKEMPKYKGREKIKKTILIAFWIQLLLMPSSLYFFRAFNIMGIINNLIFVPIVGILLPLALLDTLLIYMGWMPLAALTGKILEWGILFFHALARIMPVISFPLMTFRTHDFYFFLGLGVIFLLLSCFFSLSVKRRQVMVWAARFTVIFLLLFQLKNFFSPLTAIHFADVGHGDLALVKYNHRVILLDTGDGFLDVSSYLKQQNIYQVDLIIISHAHLDHYGGLEQLLESMPVKKVFLNQETYDTLSGRMASFDSFASVIEVIKDPKRLTMGDLVIEIFPTFCENDTNDNGLNTALSLNGHHAYFLGDISSHTMEKLKLSSQIDLLKIPHHGSRTSASHAFYKKYSIEFGLLSHGFRYRLPHQELLDLMDENTIKPLSTYYHGEVIFKKSKGKWRLETLFNNRRSHNEFYNLFQTNQK